MIQLACLTDIFLGQILLEPVTVTATCAGRDAIVVLAGEKSLPERRPDRQAHPVTLAGGHDFRLDLAIEHIIARLLHRRQVSTERTGIANRLFDLRGGPDRCSPVENFPLVHEVIHRAHGFLDLGVRVEPMAEVDIEVVGADTPE